MPRQETEQAILSRLRPSLVVMRMVWAGVAGSKIVYLVIGQLLADRAKMPQLNPDSLRLLVTTVAGVGAVLAVSSILIRSNLRNAAVRESVLTM